jgi:hypothetical protein
MDQYQLVAKTASGETVPDPYGQRKAGGGGRADVLHPGQSVSKIVHLNLWALIKEAGRYEVEGTYFPDRYFSHANLEPVAAYPLIITVFPRTKEEMDDYVQGLTNQIMARLANPIGANQRSLIGDETLVERLKELMYTGRPEMVPTLISNLCEAGGDSYESGGEFRGGMERLLATEGLLYYAPHTEQTSQAILQTADRNGLNTAMAGLLCAYGFKNEQMKPLIERALSARNPGEWPGGAELATTYYDDAFTTRLIAIASSTNIPVDGRAWAIIALANNRTDAGVKTLNTLLKDPAGQVSDMTWQYIIQARAMHLGGAPGEPLRADDFDAKYRQPRDASGTEGQR